MAYTISTMRSFLIVYGQKVFLRLDDTLVLFFECTLLMRCATLWVRLGYGSAVQSVVDVYCSCGHIGSMRIGPHECLRLEVLVV